MRYTYLDPGFFIVNQCVNDRCDGVVRDVVFLQDLIAFLALRVRKSLDFVSLPQFLSCITFTIRIGLKPRAESHGDCTAEELSQSPEDDQLGTANP